MRGFRAFERGQITLLAIILGVLGLTIGLSVSSRSLSDLRSASTVDFGTKALAAAEAGVEYALAQINQNAAYDTCAAPPDLVANGTFGDLGTNLGVTSLTVAVCRQNTDHFERKGVAQDEVVQLDFSQGRPGSVDVVWKGANSVAVTAVTTTNTVRRYAYNNNKPGISGNNFSMATSGTCGWAGAAGYEACVDNLLTNDVVLLRIRPVGVSVGTTADVYVGAAGMPAQFYEVVGTATMKSGQVRRVRVEREVSGVLPSVFDNVIYSGGSLVK